MIISIKIPLHHLKRDLINHIFLLASLRSFLNSTTLQLEHVPALQPAQPAAFFFNNDLIASITNIKMISNMIAVDMFIS